ncbi:TPA: hypothetical protein QHX44_000232 [Klebsiella oxytoca]|nr:hypothetical protein [Klebsiella oxytoca]
MKINFNDQGTVTTITVTSTVFEFRRHNRAIDIALFMAPGVICHRRGFFLMKSILSGDELQVIRAYKALLWEMAE